MYKVTFLLNLKSYCCIINPSNVGGTHYLLINERDVVMKKFKKVLAFAATMAIAMVFAVPVMAKADVTLNVTKPANWKAISVHAWDDEKGDITTWPGIALTQSGDKYTVTVEADADAKLFFVLNDNGEAFQTTNIDGLTDTDGQGEGLTAGSYDVTITDQTNSMGHYKWTLVKSGEATQVADNKTEVAEATEVPAASSPKTSDKLPVPIIAGIALLSVVAVFISRKKMSA